DEIGFEFCNARFKLSKFINGATSFAEVREGFVNLKFYNRGELKGFAVFKQDVDSDDYSMKEVLDIFTSGITNIINNTMLTYDMFRTQEQLAYSLAVVSENSSQETGQHIRRVSEYARVMGRFICETEEQLETFRIAAMLHDIGKLMIPKEIIEKPGRLTAEEFGVMKKHVIYGRDIIGTAPGEVMEMARHIILHHHERWDGTGYLGVSGEDIDQFARYVSVCDVFDALLSRRSYKEPWPAQKVYEEITSQSGRQFDPAAVEAFKKCYVEMLKIRDQFPDDDQDEVLLISDDSFDQAGSASQNQGQSVQDRRKQLPKIDVDPSIVTPISL
ncbi:MAG: HD-GYP domain-containing protein, partial [Clostridia bacterium]|nr:HD-GYP domain-containing protein [Clostridia bacterium]